MHLYYGQAGFLIGDEAGDVLLEYATALSKRGRSDRVDLRVLGPDGNEETAVLLLNPSTMITVETTRSDLEPPGNDEAVARMRSALEAMEATPVVIPADAGERGSAIDDF